MEFKVLVDWCTAVRLYRVRGERVESKLTLLVEFRNASEARSSVFALSDSLMQQPLITNTVMEDWSSHSTIA